ncbi:hypothetical protein TWF225_000729 [Orbilia oligospora]|nr:hypothetical protein TWF225_000729 [Orbilia oligospora]KAF3246997.1 hypothetical protein TWF128_008756 [Orbilia oligospora]KAF3281367.1 hypothetical protein TWF132_011252 [Orbilia oligospora]TGJ71662.1 hypothetical protein EYR41_003613 [Orbilia oligospora]
MVKFFGMDDWWILGALASNTAGTVLSVAGTFRGEGSHINDVEDEDLVYVLKLLYAEIILQPVTLNCIKLSILSFYLRLPGSNRFLILTRSTSVFVAAMMLAFILTLALACIPVSKQWDPYETRGSCINRALFWHVILALNVATNIWILVLPTRMLLALKVDRRQKIMVLSIFGCGLIATIASILALAELPLAINDPDKTWGSWRLAVYAAIQNNLGIIAASAPALKPLLGKTLRVVRSTVESKLSSTTWTPSKHGGNGRGGGGESNGSSGVKKSKVSSASAKITMNATSQSKAPAPLAGNEKKHRLVISEVMKKIISPRGSVVSKDRSSINRSGNPSHDTQAPASRSNREPALLDTIGVLPTQAAFPKNANGNRRTTRVFAGNNGSDYSGPAEIHHIRDWQLDQNDYCLDPSVEHNLPQRLRGAYNRTSVDSSGMPEVYGNSDGRKFPQVDSIEYAVSPMADGVRRTLETYEEGSNDADEEAGLTIERILSHEEWKKSGGYV